MTFRSLFHANSLVFFLLVVVFDPLHCCVPAMKSLAAQFPPAIMITEGKTALGFPYLSGGVSTDERARMEEEGKSYNVKLAFAELRGAYLSDIKLVITGAKGAEIVAVTTNGPWFFILLPPGLYAVKATFDSQTKSIDRLQVTKDKTIKRTLTWDLGAP